MRGLELGIDESRDEVELIIEDDQYTYSFDANGNMISDGKFNYTYNAANQMTTPMGIVIMVFLLSDI